MDAIAGLPPNYTDAAQTLQTRYDDLRRLVKELDVSARRALSSCGFPSQARCVENTLTSYLEPLWWIIDKLDGLIHDVWFPVHAYRDSLTWSEIEVKMQHAAGRIKNPQSLDGAEATYWGRGDAFPWEGEAGTRYRAAVPYQHSAMSFIEGVARNGASLMEGAGQAGGALVVASLWLVAKASAHVLMVWRAIVIGITAAIPTFGASLLLIPASIGIAVWETRRNWEAWTLCFLYFQTKVNSQLNMLLGKLHDLSDFPHGHWPDPTTRAGFPHVSAGPGGRRQIVTD